MADPTPYDILQDNQISALQDIVTPYYTPPGDQEYSFPVVGQGVSSDMFQQISRAAGTGVYVQRGEYSDSPYRLEDMPGGPSETNSTNRMRLRVSNATGRSEAAIEGFFHTQLQDMVVDLPAVSSPTTYRVCLTYDPRREEEPQGPIRAEVHAGPLPTTHGRKHIVLYTVERQPNQLLTDATITQTRQWLGHVINVWAYSHLPDPATVEYGTLAVVLRGNHPTMYTSRGALGWVNVLSSEWVDLPSYNNWTPHANRPQVRREGNNAQLRGIFNFDGGGANNLNMTVLPAEFRPSRELRLDAASNPYSFSSTIRVETGGGVRLFYETSSRVNWVSLDGIQFPID